MTLKSDIKRPKRKKASGRKTGIPRRLTAIVLAAVIVLVFILIGIFHPGSKRSGINRQDVSASKAPGFRKDGVARVFTGDAEIRIDIEIADEERERMQGLMYRYSMEEKQGMLFIFPEEELQSFWMKNTFIPLDIIYIGSDRKIVSIQKYTQPGSTYSLPSEKPAKYVLELNAGFTDKYQIETGDRVEF